MTDTLTEELARLNALDAKRPVGGKVRMSFTEQTDIRAAMSFDYMCDATLAFPEAIALANKLHDENERLKALLVECEKVLRQMPLPIEYDKSGSRATDGLMFCDSCKSYEDEDGLIQHTEACVVNLRDHALAKLHAAGIGK